MEARRYDGNDAGRPAVGGLRGEVTTAIARCAGCGRSSVVAELAVYGPDPGLVGPMSRLRGRTPATRADAGLGLARPERHELPSPPGPRRRAVTLAGTCWGRGQVALVLLMISAASSLSGSRSRARWRRLLRQVGLPVDLMGPAGHRPGSRRVRAHVGPQPQEGPDQARAVQLDRSPHGLLELVVVEVELGRLRRGQPVEHRRCGVRA